MPNIKVKYIIDENGDRVAPVTHIDAVRDSSGNGLSEILEDKPDATDLSAVATSGDYSDLENTPTSESAVQDGTDLSLVTTGEKYIWNNKANNTAMVGATSSAAGTSGLVPAPAVADKDKFLKGDGTWSEVGGSVKITTLTGTVQTKTVARSGASSGYSVVYYYIPMTSKDVKKVLAILITTNSTFYGSVPNLFSQNYAGGTSAYLFTAINGYFTTFTCAESLTINNSFLIYAYLYKDGAHTPYALYYKIIRIE